MPDPEIVNSLVHGAEALSGGGLSAKAIARLLGPSYDELAEGMRRWTEFRLRNLGRISDAATRKADDRPGQIHPRVAHRVLEEGSFCDDELMAEYLGGLLAASRSENGRDDRAVSWSDLVTKMSALQIRAHYLIYREFARLLRGRDDLDLGDGNVRQLATILLPFDSFAAALVGDSGFEAEEAITHSILGLVRFGLVDRESCAWGESMTTYAPVFGHVLHGQYGHAIAIGPELSAMELWGWAQGVVLQPSEFPQWAEPFELDPRLPAVNGVLPILPARTPSTGAGNS